MKEEISKEWVKNLDNPFLIINYVSRIERHAIKCFKDEQPSFELEQQIDMLGKEILKRMAGVERILR